MFNKDYLNLELINVWIFIRDLCSLNNACMALLQCNYDPLT